MPDLRWSCMTVGRWQSGQITDQRWRIAPSKPEKSVLSKAFCNAIHSFTEIFSIFFVRFNFFWICPIFIGSILANLTKDDGLPPQSQRRVYYLKLFAMQYTLLQKYFRYFLSDLIFFEYALFLLGQFWPIWPKMTDCPLKAGEECTI